MTSEHHRARAWRESRNLSLDALAELTGYSVLSIRWFEKGQRPPNRGHDRHISAWVWTRYKRACAGVEYQLRTRREFDW